MARKHQKEPQTARRFSGEEISVEALRDISILFPGDVYRLAIWIAASDRALSTPTARRGTTLYGFARHFASLAHSFEQPWTAEKVMARFREHGLKGNPVIRLPLETDTVAASIAGNDAPSNGGDLS